jgi:hypothetical protein
MSFCPLCKADRPGADLRWDPVLPCASCAELPPLERFEVAQAELARLDREGWRGPGPLSQGCLTVARDAAIELARDAARSEARTSAQLARAVRTVWREAEREKVLAEDRGVSRLLAHVCAVLRRAPRLSWKKAENLRLVEPDPFVEELLELERLGRT